MAGCELCDYVLAYAPTPPPQPKTELLEDDNENTQFMCLSMLLLESREIVNYRLSAISASRRGLAQRRHRRSGRKTFSRRPQRDAEIVDLDSAIDEQLTPGQ